MINFNYLGKNYGNAIQAAIKSLREKLSKMPVETYGQYLSACEKYLNTSGEIKIVAKSRVPWSKVISHYENGTIYYNPRKFRVMSEAEIASNFAHEAFHYLDYRHDYDWNPNRKFSIPYFIGYWVEYYLESLKKGESPESVKFLTNLNRIK